MIKIYFDHGATTKVRPEVIEAMLPYFDVKYGNPSGINSFSRDAKKAMQTARETIAGIINAQPSEIIFTSGATEANNTAIHGFIRARDNKNDHIISSRIEHSAILTPCRQLEKEGWQYNTLENDPEGFIYLDDFDVLVNPDTVLVSVMHANNEIGTIQPLKEISEILKDKNIVFHTDAAQSLGKIPFDVKESGVDLASFSAHKLYGPKGIGALYIKENVKVRPLLLGGHQELGLRAGTENVPLIIGFAKALELAVSEMETVKTKLNEFQKYIIKELSPIEGVIFNGPIDLNKRLPGNISITFLNAESDALLLHYDLQGIIISAGSACNSSKIGPSHVIKNITPENINHYGTIRVTMGRESTLEECQTFVKTTYDICSLLKNQNIHSL